MQSSYTSKAKARRIQAAAAAVRRARATTLSSRRFPLAPPRTGGFYGQWNRPRGVGEELKTIDTGIVGVTPITTAGSVALINGVATGTDYTNRIGRKIMIKSIYVRFATLPNTVTAPLGDIQRIMLIYDKQTNGAAPAVTDILNTASYLDVNNLNNRDRFVVLKDKTINCWPAAYAAGAVTAGNPNTMSFKFYKKCNLEQIFSGTGSTVGSIASGGIFLLFISAAATYNLAYSARVRFSDA